MNEKDQRNYFMYRGILVNSINLDELLTYAFQ